MGDAKRPIIEIYKDETHKLPILVQGDRTNTLRVMRARPVAIAELPAERAFRPGGAVLLPGAPDGSASPLPTLAAVLLHTRAQPADRLLVAAHGPDAALAEGRAAGLLAFLRADREAFAAHAAAAGTVEDWQRVLKWVAASRGWPCDPGDADGKAGPKTRGALAECRARWAAAFDRPRPSGEAGPADWGMFFDLYDATLAQVLDEPRAALAARRAALPLAARPAVGCGDAWAPAACRVEDHLPSTAERADLLLFAEADAPTLECHAGPGCEPKRCDVYRKKKYRAVPLAGAPVATGPVRVRLLGMLFETDKTFLLPRSLTAIKALKRLHDKRPPGEVLVVGHTDTMGARAWNLTLSVRRAEAVAAYLRDDAEAWLPWYGADKGGQRWGVREDKHMLGHRKDDAGAPFYAGPLDATASPAYHEALARFQAWSNAHQGTTLPVDGKVADRTATRRALVRAYMSEDGTTLPAATSLVVHGCGEHHPAKPTGDEVSEEENRRVEVFLFAGTATPPPQAKCPSPDGCPEWAAWVGQAVETIDLRDDLATLEVVVRDPAGDPVEGAAVAIDGRGADAGVTGADGRLVLADELPGAYRVKVTKQGFADVTVDAEAPGLVEVVLVRIAPALARALPGAAFVGATACPGPGAVEHLRWVAREADLTAWRPVRLFAHAAPGGDDAAAKALTDRRARAVRAVLAQDLDAFDALAAEEAWGPRQDQALLRALGIDPGPIDGKVGPQTQRAVRGFQRDFAAGVFHARAGLAARRPAPPVDGALSPATRAALRDAFLAWAAEGPPVGADAFVGPDDGASGCAGFNPRPEDGPGGRVDVAVFTEPPPEAFPCRRGDAAACPLDGAGPQRCPFYRHTVALDDAAAREPFTDLAWQLEADRSLTLSALAALPDGAPVTFSVQRCDVALGARPPTSASTGQAAPPALGPTLATLAGQVLGGVATARWTPAKDDDPLDWTRWLAPEGAAGPALRPPRFVVASGPRWAVSPPPGPRLDRLRFAPPGAVRGAAILADGRVVSFSSKDGLARERGAEVVALQLEGLAGLGVVAP